MRKAPCRCLAKSCAKLLADGAAKFCAKLSKQISGNNRPTRLARPTRPTSPSAKREAQSLALHCSLQVAKHYEMGLCAPCRGAPTVVVFDSVVKDQISACRTCISASHFQSAKHIFKASVACNGREVLHGTPGRRHGISAIEAADCLGNREPTIHWKVSRTSAACRVGSRKHLSPSAMRSEPVGRIPGAEVTLRLAGITCPLINSRQNRGCVNQKSDCTPP